MLNGLFDGIPLLGDGGLLGGISKVTAAGAFIITVWALFVLRQKPGYAGVLLSWNKPLSTKTHRRDECVRNCGHGTRIAIARIWVKTGRPEPRDWKRKIVRYQKCRKGCKCEHEMARIIWPQITPKLPWRKAHQIPTLLRTDELDPIPVDIVDPKTGEISQRLFHCVVDWRVCTNRRRDAPYWADHELNVIDLTKTVVEEITTATRYAELNHRITRLSQEPGPVDGSDRNNRKAISNLVKKECAKKLFKNYGAIIIDFRFGDNARTPQQVLADAISGSSGKSSVAIKAITASDVLDSDSTNKQPDDPDQPTAPGAPASIPQPPQ